MHDGHDQNVSFFNRVKHGVRKNPHQAAPHVVLKRSPAAGISLNPLYADAYLLGESPTQINPSRFVKSNSFVEFQNRLGMECVCHLSNNRPIRRYTSAAGIGFTLPDRTSSRRRIASWAHCVSRSASSKLATRRSARKILSLAGSCSIVSARFFKVAVMAEAYHLDRQRQSGNSEFGPAVFGVWVALWTSRPTSARHHDFDPPPTGPPPANKPQISCPQ
jgi:hypothetical protein